MERYKKGGAASPEQKIKCLISNQEGNFPRAPSLHKTLSQTDSMTFQAPELFILIQSGLAPGWLTR